MIKRTISCDVCGTEHIETDENSGFPNWGQLSGVTLSGVDNPLLCPRHLAAVANFLDTLKNKENT